RFTHVCILHNSCCMAFNYATSLCYSVQQLFLIKSESSPILLRMGSGNTPSHPGRSNDELRLEIHVADGIHVYHRRCRVALLWAGRARLAVVVFGDRNRLCCPVDVARYEKKVRAARLSVR